MQVNRHAVNRHVFQGKLLRYVMLYGYLYSASRIRLFRGALSRQVKKVFKLRIGTQMIFPVASHSGVQEEYHSKVQDPQLKMPGSGIEKFGTKVRDQLTESMHS